MAKKTAAKQKIVLPGIYKLILVLAVLLALVSIYVVLNLQNEIDHMALADKIYFMQK